MVLMDIEHATLSADIRASLPGYANQAMRATRAKAKELPYARACLDGKHRYVSFSLWFLPVCQASLRLYPNSGGSVNILRKNLARLMMLV